MTTRPPRSFLVWLALVVTAGALVAAPVAAAESLEDLRQAWEIVARRMDERGRAEQQEVLERIADLDTPEARDTLLDLRKRYGTGDRRRAALILSALVRRADPDALDEVVTWVEAQRDPALLERLGDVLASAEKPATRSHLRGAALRRAMPGVKAQMARALGRLDERAAVPALLLLLREPHLDVRVQALEALGQIGDALAVGPVLVFLQDPEPWVRDAAARALGQLGDARAVRPLERALADDHPRVAESAALALAALGDRTVVPALIGRLEVVRDEDLRVADALVRTLGALTGKALGLDVSAWKAWWETVKDRPWEAEAAPPEGRTVPARRYYSFPIHSSRLVFVLDVSRSMGWNQRLDDAKRELIRVLEELPPTTRFNIVTYSNVAEAWQSTLRPATPSFVRKATAFVRRQRPESGTNTWHALELAFRDENADTVFFLSDGNPSLGKIVDPDLILAEVRRLNRYRRVRVHGVALVRGDPPQGYAALEDRQRALVFMEHLASENDGRFQLVE